MSDNGHYVKSCLLESFRGNRRAGIAASDPMAPIDPLPPRVGPFDALWSAVQVLVTADRPTVAGHDDVAIGAA